MLDKESLQQAIEAALDHEATQQDDAAASRTRIAGKLAEAIDTFIKSASVVYTGGLVAPNGAVTGVFNGKLE